MYTNSQASMLVLLHSSQLNNTSLELFHLKNKGVGRQSIKFRGEGRLIIKLNSRGGAQEISDDPPPYILNGIALRKTPYPVQGAYSCRICRILSIQ